MRAASVKRLFAAVLAALLLLLPGCGTSTTSADAGYITAAGYTAEAILSYFSEVTFGSEYGGYRGTVCKWTDEVRLWLTGDFSEEETAVLDDLITRLNGIDGFPGILRVESEEDANFVLRFVMQGDLVDYFGGNAENASGMSSYTWKKATGEILSAHAGVACNISPAKAKSSVICEELLQSLGLASDAFSHPESVFYEGYNASPRPAEIDWALVTLLYHEAITPGMAYGDAMDAAAALLGIPETEIKDEETMYG